MKVLNFKEAYKHKANGDGCNENDGDWIDAYCLGGRNGYKINKISFKILGRALVHTDNNRHLIALDKRNYKKFTLHPFTDDTAEAYNLNNKWSLTMVYLTKIGVYNAAYERLMDVKRNINKNVHMLNKFILGEKNG